MFFMSGHFSIDDCLIPENKVCSMILHLQNQISVWGSSQKKNKENPELAKYKNHAKTRRVAPYTLDATVLFGNKILDFCSHCQCFFIFLTSICHSRTSSSTYTHFPGDFI